MLFLLADFRQSSLGDQRWRRAAANTGIPSQQAHRHWISSTRIGARRGRSTPSCPPTLASSLSFGAFLPMTLVVLLLVTNPVTAAASSPADAKFVVQKSRAYYFLFSPTQNSPSPCNPEIPSRLLLLQTVLLARKRRPSSNTPRLATIHLGVAQSRQPRYTSHRHRCIATLSWRWWWWETGWHLHPGEIHGHASRRWRRRKPILSGRGIAVLHRGEALRWAVGEHPR